MGILEASHIASTKAASTMAVAASCCLTKIPGFVEVDHTFTRVNHTITSVAAFED